MSLSGKIHGKKNLKIVSASVSVLHSVISRVSSSCVLSSNKTQPLSMQRFIARAKLVFNITSACSHAGQGLVLWTQRLLSQCLYVSLTHFFIFILQEPVCLFFRTTFSLSPFFLFSGLPLCPETESWLFSWPNREGQCSHCTLAHCLLINFFFLM